MSLPLPVRQTNASSLNGAGDQVARSQFESVEIRRMLRPSAPITYTCGPPERSDVKAICGPAGDQAGSQFCPLLAVGFCSVPSKISEMKRSGNPRRYEVYAID